MGRVPRPLPANGNMRPLPNRPPTLVSYQLVKDIVSDRDKAMIKQITEIHAGNGQEFELQPILQIVEHIFSSAAPPILDAKPKDAVEDNVATTVLEELPYIINPLSCEISYKCTNHIDADSTTVSLFSMLSPYSWEAKLVLTLAAFAVKYGEFWLLTQVYLTNKLAKRMAMLKQLPHKLENMAQLKPGLYELEKLIKSIVELSSCIVALTQLSKHISKDNPALYAAVTAMPCAVYWSFISVVSCATYITNFSSMGYRSTISTTEVLELSNLADKIKTIYERLQEQLIICNQEIEEKEQLEAYDALLHIFEGVHIDNMKVLSALMPTKDDMMPLLFGTTKRRDNLEVLRQKTVLLLISRLDISTDEVAILEQIYLESQQHPERPENQFVVVWIPVVDRSAEWTDASQEKFEALQSSMPWYTVYNPSLIDQVVIRYIKDNWQFRSKPILAVIDQLGKVVSPNALHMLWIWRSTAYPFSSTREVALWKKETLKLDVLVDGIDPMILDWIKEDKHIILYGGDDIEWIRKFTSTARSAAQSARIPLEMIYVGKSGKREQIRRITAIIQRENLSNVVSDAMIWFFWSRIESMLFSNIQVGSADEGDLLQQEIKKLISYDKSGVWALFSKRSNVVMSGFGTTVLAALLGFDEWKNDVPEKGFDGAFKKYYENLPSIDHPCCRFEFPTNFGRIPENMKCPECQSSMEKYVTFSCCHDMSIRCHDPISPPLSNKKRQCCFYISQSLLHVIGIVIIMLAARNVWYNFDFFAKLVKQDGFMPST